MVCDLTDSWDQEHNYSELTGRMLCATMYLLREAYGSYSNVYALLDYKEAGVDRKEFIEWHEQHLEQYRIRILRESALQKLTFEERQALGLE